HSGGHCSSETKRFFVLSTDAGRLSCPRMSYPANWVKRTRTALRLPPSVSAPSIESMRPVVVWGMEVFLFCSALGLFLSEYRLLRRAGFGARQLRSRTERSERHDIQ